MIGCTLGLDVSRLTFTFHASVVNTGAFCLLDAGL